MTDVFDEFVTDSLMFVLLYYYDHYKLFVILVLIFYCGLI